MTVVKADGINPLNNWFIIHWRNKTMNTNVKVKAITIAIICVTKNANQNFNDVEKLTSTLSSFSSELMGNTLNE